MEILDLLNKNQMNFNIEADTKENVIHEMAKMFLKDGVITDIGKYTDSVMERERTGTTGVGGGIAIPHGKSDVVKTSSIAFAKLNHPVDWDALDGKKVSMVFMLSIPEGSESKEHLRVLSLLAQRLMDDDVIDALKVAKTKEDIINIFKNKEITQ
ncbi:PTS sugar transporter subunit IIA [Companilactobacillus huachuanensis]|uniref:PTS sugar transporter subunit IIA n=1 Tax=Companilactobacillus huachuanensis TaxID=2559914 RepID=A0ABW1RPM9_9LACO|nr:fructose PTS transporter subunit IIA [Companilactobacillus huachuanensis]